METIFKKESFGKPMSYELSQYIVYCQKENDVKEVALKYGYAPEILTEIVNRVINISSKNHLIVTELFKRCVNNYTNLSKEKKERINKLLSNSK